MPKARPRMGETARAIKTPKAPTANAADRAIAGPAPAPRVPTSVAIAFAASWSPFVNANASAKVTASHSSMARNHRPRPP